MTTAACKVQFLKNHLTKMAQWVNKEPEIVRVKSAEDPDGRG